MNAPLDLPLAGGRPQWRELIARRIACFLLPLGLALGAPSQARAAAYGSLNNFDVVNDTGSECHGFEIEIEGIHSRDITHTYNWNHYGTPKLTEDLSDPARPRLRVRYESAKNPDGTWAAYTAIPSGPIAATDGHRFTNPGINFGGEHFGVGFRGAGTNITYHWLVDNGAGVLVRGPAVSVATPTFSYFPPVGIVPAQVQAVIEAPPAPPVLEFGPATWVKEIRTTTHNNREVKLRDLVSDDPDDAEDRNWRNGEPDEVEMEWQLLQTEFSKLDGGQNHELAAAPEDLPGGDEVVTRRYEFYKYVGPLDDESGEAKASSVGPDGIHGVGIKQINGVDVDLATVVVVGDYLGSQMSAFDADASVGLIDHVQDGEVNTPYPTRTLVIAGNAPFAATNWGVLPAGMTFDRVSGELSGTPAESGAFAFTVQASAGNDPVVTRTYTLTIAAANDVLPPRSMVETVAEPSEGGTTTGDGSYANDTRVTVSALPAAGFVFSRWTDHGETVSQSAVYTFTNIVHRALTAHFVPEPPRLSFSLSSLGQFALTWPTNEVGMTLQHSADLKAGSWVVANEPVAIVGSDYRVVVNPVTGTRYFRLVRP